MASFLESLNSSLINFIQDQQMFFVATAAQDGRINLSPKGLDSLRIIDHKNILWLNYTGSGNETAAHLLALNRITIMFCSFGSNPLILRIYGTANVTYPNHEDWSASVKQFSRTENARNIFEVQIESVQTSCGYGVPIYEFVSQRDRLIVKKDQEELAKYWKEKNLTSIDGLPTGLEK